MTRLPDAYKKMLRNKKAFLNHGGTITSLSKKENGKVEPWWISGGVEECIAKAEEIADAKFDAAAYAKRHASWMSTKIDCTVFLTYFIEGYPATVKEVRAADKSFWERFK